MNKNKNGISYANIVSVIGVVAFALAWFVSVAYISFNLVAPTIAALAAAIIASLLLVFAIRFKQVDSAEPRWKVFEYLFVGLLCIVILGSVLPVSHYIDIQANRDSLKKTALSDIDSIRVNISSFKAYEQDALTRTCTGLDDAFASSGSGVGEGLKKYMQENQLTGKASVESFKRSKTERIDNITLPNSNGGNGAESYNEVWQTGLDNAAAVFQAWSVFRIPQAVDITETVAAQTSEVLPLMASQLDFPEIRRIYSVYDILPYSASAAQTASRGYTPRFRDKISAMGYFNLLGLLTMIVIGLLILFNYFIIPGSKREAISKEKSDLGQLL
ncbi:MAG: hypothetical protein NC328_02075 [Muribaculum sp.]|nr:hypothetical protein [Muribaculum sp.]